MGIFRHLFADPQTTIIQVLYSLPAILIALSFHEWAHAYAAYRLGDPTARNLGRMTLNPFSHIDPIGFVMLLFVRFGWARPVPINPRNFKKPRRDDTIVSLAGVTVNFLLAFASVIILYIYIALGGRNDVLMTILDYFCIINLGLMVFNLIPIPPLDGSHVLENLLIRTVGPRPFVFLSKYSVILLVVLLFAGRGLLQTAVGSLRYALMWVVEELFLLLRLI